MSPPGKNNGVTTNESVVSASREQPISSSAASVSGSSRGLRNASRKIASTSVLVALPPAPCARVIRSSFTAARRLRARSMRSSTCCSLSEELIGHSPPARARG